MIRTGTTTYYEKESTAKAQATMQNNKYGTDLVVRKCPVMGYYLTEDK